MLRLLLTWRWVALTLVLVLAVATMLVLGQWQWERSRPSTAAVATDPTSVADPAALPEPGDLLGPSTSVPRDLVGEAVRVTGTWVPERTLLVADRPGPDGAPGRWVVTGLRTDDGALVPVVRGWVPAEPLSPAQDVAAPASGQVTVLGWLQDSEPLDIPVEIAQPDGVVPLLATPDLVNRWPEELVGGFVVQAGPALDGTPAATDGLEPAPLAEPPEDPATEPRDWRNLAYAGQWWVFAAFAVVLWWRMLRDEHQRGRRGENDANVREGDPQGRDRRDPRDANEPAERSTA